MAIGMTAFWLAIMAATAMNSIFGARGKLKAAEVAAASQEKMMTKQLEMAGTLRERESEATKRALKATERRTAAATKATAEAKGQAQRDAFAMSMLPMILQKMSGTSGGPMGPVGGLPLVGESMTSDQRAMGGDSLAAAPGEADVGAISSPWALLESYGALPEEGVA